MVRLGKAGLVMFDHVARQDGAAVARAWGDGGGAPRWPGGVSAGAVGRAVWGALVTAGGPVTVRQVAQCASIRRESVGRVLAQLERAGWARRERGDVKAGVPDSWMAADVAREAWVCSLSPRTLGEHVDGGSAPGVVRRARMRAVASTAPPALVRGREAVCACAGRASGRDAAAPVRLAGGKLQEQVLGVLRDAVPEAFGPVQLARLLGGRSQGAIANACERLVASGEAVRTCAAPLRFAAAEAFCQ